MILRTAMLATLYTACAAAHCWTLLSAHADDPVLTTYFEVASESVLNSQFREALEISPAQNESLRKLIEDPALLKKLDTERRAIQREIPKLGFETAWRIAQLRVDDLVSSELAKILSPQQLKIAKPTYIKQKYSSGLAPFGDLDLLIECGASPSDLKLLKPKLDAATAELIKGMEKIRAEAAKCVLAAFPDDSKQLFAAYAGNKYLPEFEVDNAISPNALPYSAFVRPGGLMHVLLSPDQSAKELGLTDDQVNRIEVIQRSYRSSVSSATRGGRSAAQLRKAFEEESSKNAEALEKTLSKDQLLKLYRSRASSEFTSDFATTLNRPELITYLRLTSEQAAEIHRKAFEASQEMARQSNERQQEKFEEVCGAIAPAPRAVLLRLFDGVWKPDESQNSQD